MEFERLLIPLDFSIEPAPPQIGTRQPDAFLLRFVGEHDQPISVALDRRQLLELCSRAARALDPQKLL